MSEEGLDSTSSMVHVMESGSEEEIKMLLGGRERIRPTGIIRAGKQVPIGKCTPAEKELFLKLEAEGIPYEDVNRRMGGKPRSKESKLTMVNTDHFVIRECDWKKKEDCEYILKHYADPDGLVRRIPVFFTVNDISKAIPHGFVGFSGSGQVRCKSFYDGDDLKFRYIKKSVDVPKESDWEILDSTDEDEATKACGYKVTFAGLFRVSVVGLKGIGDVLVPTKSWNGIQDAVSVLEKVKRRMKRFDGLLNGASFFDLVKVQEYVKHEGKRVKQHYITLELSVDPMEIERYSEPYAVAARASQAMQLLTGTAPRPAAAAEPPQPQHAAASPAEPVDDLPAALGEQQEQGNSEQNDAELYQQAVALCREAKEVSISAIQRRLRIGYNRASVLVDEMAKAGIVSAPDQNGHRMLIEQDPAAERVKKGIEALNKLASTIGLLPADLDNLAASTFGGALVETLELPQIENFYRQIHASFKTNGDSFVADVKAMRKA